MASFPQVTNIINLKAGSDLSAKLYKGVILSADGAVDVAGANAKAIGFLMNAPVTGGICEIASAGGGAKATAGGTIAAGAFLNTDSAGDVVTAVVNSVVVGRALTSAVDNDVFEIEVLFTLSGTATV